MVIKKLVIEKTQCCNECKEISLEIFDGFQKMDELIAYANNLGLENKNFAVIKFLNMYYGICFENYEKEIMITKECVWFREGFKMYCKPAKEFAMPYAINELSTEKYFYSYGVLMDLKKIDNDLTAFRMKKGLWEDITQFIYADSFIILLGLIFYNAFFSENECNLLSPYFDYNGYGAFFENHNIIGINPFRSQVKTDRGQIFPCNFFYPDREIIQLIGKSSQETRNLKLCSAAEYGRLSVVESLLAEGADIHAYDDMALRNAALSQNYDIVKFLVQNGAFVGAENDAALRNAIRHLGWSGQLKEIIEFLLSNGANVHVNNDKALRMASKKENLDVVSFLVHHGANVHANNDEPLRLAIKDGKKPINSELIKVLIKNGANIHVNDEAPLRIAIKKGCLELVKFMIEHGADTSIMDDEALSLLRTLIIRKHIK